jgi:ferredoxin-NADP reductase
LRVSRIARESNTVFSLELVPGDHRPLAIALPGQFVVVRLHLRPDGPPLLRSYSLSEAPSTECYRLGVKQEAEGAASGYLAAQLKVGDSLEVSAPRGSFVLRAGDRPVVLLSAGIGLTPVLAMLHALATEPSKRMVWWLHGARSGNEHPFAEEARRLLSRLSHSRSYVQYSKPDPADRQGENFDAPGRLELAVLNHLGVSHEADFYLCGPTAFLRDFTEGLRAWGVPHDRVYTEIFGPGKPSTPGIVHAPVRSPHPFAGASEKKPRVSFARSGLDVAWDPKFKSLLELAEACDVPVQWSCRTGVCHTCEAALIDGTVNYDPEPVEAPATGNLLTCCSRPQGDVIIDL